MATLVKHVLRRKPALQIDQETGADTNGGELTRSIGLAQLSMFGIGATIGTGIFFVLSQAVPVAGPAVIISFVVAGVVAGLTAICYAELAGAVPASGSSYSYAYATLGELPAMAVGACLLLEYGVSAAAVSGRMVAVFEPATGQPLRVPDSRRIVTSAGAGRHHQSARSDPGVPVRCSAHPRRQ